MRRLSVCLLMFAFLSSQLSADDSLVESHDVVIYGGTCAAVIAAVQAKKMGKSVVVVSPDKHLGGLSSGGLGWTDTGNKSVIGGLSRDFYHRVYLAYQDDAAWKQQEKHEYGNRGQGTAAIDGENRTMWIFEPHIAEQIFDDYVREFEIPVHRDEWLDRESGVTRAGNRISEIKTLSGRRFRGKMFIDATYEGDLMATAGVDYHVGRESKETYGEEYAGVQTGVLHHGHHFDVLKRRVSPYVDPSDPSSGVIARVSADPPGEKYSADNKIQAYCFRMCLTNHPENRIPFAKPEGYDPAQYELLARIYDAGWGETFGKFDPIPNHKTDTNNHGPMSTDNIGRNYDYPDGSYERRREIIREHETYQKGWLYFIANDPRVPEATRKQMQQWGLPKDEFVDNGNWSHQLYIREARRMIGEYVMTENELLKRRPTPQSVGMGSYAMDSHNVQRYITDERYVQNEGDIGVSTNGPYEIAFRSLLPKKSQCENLVVPVCVSSSHIAFGSIRMEPVFMILGQSAATTAVLAIDVDGAVQDVSYDTLKERLLADGQILTYSGPIHVSKHELVAVNKLDGIVVDDADAERTSIWTPSTASVKAIGVGYVHDGNTRDGKTSLAFVAKLPESGEYEVRFAYAANANRAGNAKVIVKHADGEAEIVVDQRKAPAIDGLFISLGTFRFDADNPASVTISNRDANGYVVADAVQWLPRSSVSPSR